MQLNFFVTACLLLSTLTVNSQISQPVKRLLSLPSMRGASFSIQAKDVQSGDIVVDFNSNREITPASVMKTVTTSTALEMLGSHFRYETRIEYDGVINDGILNGNIYIHGSGDPTLGSAYLKSEKDSVIFLWAQAIADAGVRRINGSIIADERIFDSEGVSMKWMREDLGSYYAQGSYGLSVFDNLYRLYLETGEPGKTPVILRTVPEIPGLSFKNYLQAANGVDSSMVVGSPFSSERSLYGVVPARRKLFELEGDIPDPALFLAQYLNSMLTDSDIPVMGEPTTYRLLSQQGKWVDNERKTIIRTYSPDLAEIVRIVNHVSHNLFADVLLKTLGERFYKPEENEVISSFGKGIKVIREYWKEKGLDVSSLWMYDGSGIAITDKLTTSFACDLYVYMATRSKEASAFWNSLPKAGEEGTLRNVLRGTSLQGKARLKSGSMGRVRCYGGYVSKRNKKYAVCILSNHFSCSDREMIREIEKLLVALFQ